MTRLWIGFTLAIAGVATYPFDFQWGAVDASAALGFFDSCCRELRQDDILLGIGGFAPFGYLGMQSQDRRRPILRRLCLVIFLGTAFALFIQAVHLLQPSHSASLQGVAWGFLAVACGALLTALTLNEAAAGNTARTKRKEAATLPETGNAVTVAINLRQGQAAFLDRLAEVLGVDSSDACRRLIAAMTPGPADNGEHPGDDPAIALRQAAEAARQGGHTAGHAWTKREIMLDRASLKRVEQSSNGDESLSRRLRHLIAAAKKDTGGDGVLSDSAAAPSAGRSRRRPRRGRRRLTYGLRAFAVLALIGAPVAVIVGLLMASGERLPMVVTAAPWADQSAFILLDHHSHTTFSDGALDVGELASLARNAGCNALAITDHADAQDALSPAQFDAFRDARHNLPGFLLFGGVEINMPSYGQREHVTVMVPPDVEETVLPALRDVAETGAASAQGSAGKAELDRDFLDLAADFLERGDRLLMIYNHPSREDPTAQENEQDMLRWNARAPLFIGFAGAPGHQNADEPGDYKKPLLTIDRWDPVVAEVGGTWDRLLSEGYQLWGAIAGSDFHNSDLDRIPCTFSRTHVAAPGFTYEAILDALRAGTFWADHGRLLQELSLSAQIEGLRAPVYPGSVVSLGSGDPLILVQVALLRGTGADGAPLQVEFIGNCRTGESEILATQELLPGETNAAITLAATASGTDRRSCFVRARVRHSLRDAPDLMAYTNPIRFLLR